MDLVLVSLVGEDLESGGNTFGRELLQPTFASAPQAGKILFGDGETGLDIAFISMEFPLPFDWDLT